MKKIFIYFSEVFYFPHLLSEKIIPLIQILKEIQNSAFTIHSTPPDDTPWPNYTRAPAVHT